MLLVKSIWLIWIFYNPFSIGKCSYICKVSYLSSLRHLLDLVLQWVGVLLLLSYWDGGEDCWLGQKTIVDLKGRCQQLDQRQPPIIHLQLLNRMELILKFQSCLGPETRQALGILNCKWPDGRLFFGAKKKKKSTRSISIWSASFWLFFKMPLLVDCCFRKLIPGTCVDASFSCILWVFYQQDWTAFVLAICRWFCSPIYQNNFLVALCWYVNCMLEACYR